MIESGWIVTEKTAGAEELMPNTTDGACENPVPVIEQKVDFAIVKVGSVAYPMLEARCVTWIVPGTSSGYQKIGMKPGDVPEASFAVTDPAVAVYEYCNLHRLWMAKA